MSATTTLFSLKGSARTAGLGRRRENHCHRRVIAAVAVLWPVHIPMQKACIASPEPAPRPLDPDPGPSAFLSLCWPDVIEVLL